MTEGESIESSINVDLGDEDSADFIVELDSAEGISDSQQLSVSTNTYMEEFSLSTEEINLDGEDIMADLDLVRADGKLLDFTSVTIEAE